MFKRVDMNADLDDYSRVHEQPNVEKEFVTKKSHVLAIMHVVTWFKQFYVEFFAQEIDKSQKSLHVAQNAQL